MEEQLTELLKNSLESIGNIQPNVYILDKYYELFDEKDYKKLFLDNNINEIYNDMQEYYSIDLNYLNYGHNEIEMQKLYQELIFAVFNTEDTHSKIKLIPLVVFLDKDYILYEFLYEKDFFTNINEFKSYCLDILHGFQVNLDLTNTPTNHWENDIVHAYTNGIKTLDFKNIYKFIDSLQRGIGIVYHPYIDFLSYISNKLFFDDLCNILDNQETLKIKYLTHSLTIEDRLRLANKSISDLMLFETIRETVYFKSNNQYSLNLLKHERELLTNLIVKIANNEVIWSQFLDYYLEYPSRATQLFSPLGLALEQIDQNKLLIIGEKIKIDKFFDNDSKEALNCCFSYLKDEKLKKRLIENIFIRWIDFVDNYDDTLVNIILSDVIDIVLMYVNEYMDKKDIMKNINHTIYDIEEINNRWFIDATDKDNSMFKLLSKLFVYCFFIKQYAMPDIEIKMREFVNSRKFFVENGNQHEMSTAELFYQNIFNKNMDELNG